MHRIHVRTGVVDLPFVDAHEDRPTHDQFEIPTGPGEEVVELELLDIGWARVTTDLETEPREFRRRKKTWRFRVVSVEKIGNSDDIDIVVDEQITSEVDAEELAGRVKGLLGRSGNR